MLRLEMFILISNVWQHPAFRRSWPSGNPHLLGIQSSPYLVLFISLWCTAWIAASINDCSLYFQCCLRQQLAYLLPSSCCPASCTTESTIDSSPNLLLKMWWLGGTIDSRVSFSFSTILYTDDTTLC